jgi:hypothetical protein
MPAAELDKATQKDKLVKAVVYVRQQWVDEIGADKVFKSANINADRKILVVPVTHFDISDRNFVEVVFWPSALADQPMQSVKAFIPKEFVSLILELKHPDALPALGFKLPSAD